MSLPANKMKVLVAVLFVLFDLGESRTFLARIRRSPQGIGDGLDGLRATIPGEPGVDYPIYPISVVQRLNRERNLARVRQRQQQQQEEQQQPRGGREGTGEGGGVDIRQVQFQAQIAAGEVPGVPGRDYPTNSLSGLRGRFPSLQPAPAELVTPDFPARLLKNKGNRNSVNNSRPKNKKKANERRKQQQQQQRRQQQQQQQRRQQQQREQEERRRQQQQQAERRRQQQQQAERRRQQQERRLQEQQQKQQQQQQQPRDPPAIPTPRPTRRTTPRTTRRTTTTTSRPRTTRRTTTTRRPPPPQRPFRAPTVPATEEEPAQIFNGRYCPGNSVETCRNFCPREPERFAVCDQECRESC